MNKVYDDLDKGLRECTQCKVDCFVPNLFVNDLSTTLPTTKKRVVATP